MQAAPGANLGIKGRLLAFFQRLKKLYLRNKLLSVPLSATLLAGVIAVLLIVVFRPTDTQPPVVLEANQFTLEALQKDTTGVDPSSQFLLSSENPIEANKIEAALKIVPEKEYELDKISDTEYKIKFAEALSKDKIYRFELVGEEGGVEKALSWAFQVKGSFRIIQTLPKSKSTGVPTNSGVEITFSHENFELKGIEEYFDIKPKVVGKFEKHKRTLVFVPKKLSPSTLYTVKFKKGLKLSGSREILNDGKIFQFETTGPTREWVDYFSFSSKTYEFPKSEKPVLNGWGQVKPTGASVYKLDEKTFLDSLKKVDAVPAWTGRQSKKYTTKGLTKFLQFDPIIKKTRSASYIEFPKKIPKGFYLVELENAGRISQAWLQITPLSAYSVVSRTKTMFWVNSVATKKPVEGANVELIGGGIKAQTNKEGIVESTTPDKLKNNKYHYFKVTGQGAVLIVRIGESYFSDPVSNQYWYYLYLDRGLYRTSDSISFWGLARSRESTQPKKVSLELKQDSYVDYFYKPIVIISKEVELSESNTFNGSLDFTNLNPGSYTVSLKIDSQVVGTKYIQVGIFDKPAYQIKATPSRKAVFVGEIVKYKVRTEFFEGTPAPNVSLKVSGAVEKTIKTNTNGEVSLTVKAKPEKYYPQTQGIYISSAESEVGDIYAGALVQVFSSAIKMTGEGRIEGDKAKVEGSVKSVDLSKVEDIYKENYLDGPVSTNLKARVYETSWLKKVTGEYYDFIEKKTFKTYEYEQKKELIGTLAEKSDQNGKFTLEFDVDPAKDYQVEISAKDSEGRREKTTIYVSRSVNTDDPISYYLENTKDYPAEYKIGEKVELKFKKGKEDLKPNPNLRFLYYQSRNGIRSFSMSNSATYSFTFEENHLPNVYITGVFFNGFTYKSSSNPHSWRAGGTLINFDESEKSLKIKVKTEKKRYQPGDTVRIEVSVEDNNGKPVAAEVNLNVIDESLYAVSYDKNLDPLADLYSNIGNGLYASYLSHQYPEEAPGQGGGGGGGDRQDFRDKVYFGVVKTGSDGKGSVEVKLPDNLTTWRVSTQAVTEDLKIGKGVGSIEVGKDLFVEANVPSEFLVVDKPEIKLRAFGNALKLKDAVEFTVKAESLGWKEAKKVKGQAFKASFVKLPKLKLGVHKITVSVKAKGLTDTVIKQIQVIEARTKVGKINEYSLTPGLKLSGGSGRNTLTFINEIQGGTYPILRRQLWSFSDRLETKLAQKIAANLLKEHFDEDHYVDPVNFVRYQTRKGGLSIFPYSDNDLELSAKVASFDANNFDKDGLRNYFLSILDDKKEGRERSLIALWGLASIGDPVLVRLENFTKGVKLSLREQLYVALAHLELGNKEKAREIFDTILDKSAENKPPYVYIKDKDKDESLRLTAYAALIGAKLQDKNTTSIMRFLADERPKELLSDLERVLASVDYLNGFTTNEASFTMNLGGEEKAVTLEGEPYKVSVSAKELKEASFKDIEGKVLVNVSYETSLSKSGLSRDNSLVIKRRYSEDNNVTTKFSEGALVKVTIDYDVSTPTLTGCYQVTDHLPSGLRAVTNPYRYVSERDIWYVYQNTGQTISFCVTKQYDKPIKYFARVAAKGEYLAEPAIIQHKRAKDFLNFTSSQTVTIP